MNKEEIQAKLHNYEERLKDVAGEIERLREQLAEAEKPKLRHGDFGLNKAGNSRLILFQFGDSNREKRKDYGPIGIHSNTDIEPLGNIFDLLKEWSEDLEMWERPTKRHNKFVFKICGCTIDFHTNPYCSFIPDEAEEIWHKLGQMIATLKRKEIK